MQKSIIIEQHYPCSPDEVWDALTDQSQISEWLSDSTFEPRLGAEFEFRWSKDGQSGVTHCKILELVRPQKLSYTWEKPSWSTNVTVVTYYLEASNGGTILRLEHVGFVEGKDDQVYQGATNGWDEKLAALSQHLNRISRPMEASSQI
ncbi:MAG: SRPBCC domain-containing protein [Bacteroidota bacterium]|nr:SRPBCC domain-containing protein [Bacteroidota bacterium]MDP4232522.1 SRPBCC domain-containing protein [Bacteroidota bacterium]MDP4241657.1 SRPBCC domain-containing protein [Bacteroidota bacterium]MDP4286402.1 SRPBCC domain-containing protein [Bacteroidota bacterium]